MIMTNLQTQLEALIEQTGALQQGHFQLASGLHATRFFRCIKLLRFPQTAAIMFAGLAQRFSDERIDYVLGANEAGSILAFEVAKVLGAEMAIARPKNGIYHLIGGFALPANSRVLVVDDITTTGGTAKQLIQIIQAANAVAVGVGLVATKGIFDVDLGCRTEILLQLEGMDAIASDQCELCRQAVPLTT